MLFISHSTLDKSHALDLQRRLGERGYVCEQHFLDSEQRSGIKLGEKWEKVIYDNLRDCQALLVLCSSNWLQSKWCFAELAAAKMSGKQIFPIIVQDCDRSSLSEFQATFINSPDLGKNEEAFERLFQDLEGRGLGPRDWLPWPNPDLKDANGQIDACPFPGLPAFDERYAAVYFGREREKQKLLEELRQMRTNGEPRLLMIVGGSGSGKSSLLLAGLLPTLKHSTFCDEWLVLSTVRFARRTSPNALFESLVDDIVARYPSDAQQQLDLPDRQNLLRDFSKPVSEAAKSFSEVVRRLAIALGRANATALLPINQFEEFLSESSASEGGRFLEFLKELCQHRDDRLVVVGTMRSDYLEVYEHHKHRLKTPCFKQWRLEPFDLALLSRIIQSPALRGHVDVEGDLVDQLKKDTPSADALPQLSFALQQLYRRFASGREQPKLTTDDYTEIGRIDGLIKAAAEQLFDPHTQSDAVVAAVRLSFVKHLAEVSDRDEFVRLSARWDDLDPLAWPILDRLVSQRLLVKAERQGAVFLEVAHEALFRCWPLLNGWLKATADILRWRRDVRRDQQSARSSDRVWKGLTSVQFAVAKKWPTTRRAELADIEVGWIRDASKRRSFAWTGVGFVAVLILVSASFAWWQRGRAEQREQEATLLRLAAQSQLTSRAVEDAARYLRESNSSCAVRELFTILEAAEPSDPLRAAAMTALLDFAPSLPRCLGDLGPMAHAEIGCHGRSLVVRRQDGRIETYAVGDAVTQTPCPDVGFLATELERLKFLETGGSHVKISADGRLAALVIPGKRSSESPLRADWRVVCWRLGNENLLLDVRCVEQPYTWWAGDATLLVETWDPDPPGMATLRGWKFDAGTPTADWSVKAPRPFERAPEFPNGERVVMNKGKDRVLLSVALLSPGQHYDSKGVPTASIEEASTERTERQFSFGPPFREVVSYGAGRYEVLPVFESNYAASRRALTSVFFSSNGSHSSWYQGATESLLVGTHEGVVEADLKHLRVLPHRTLPFRTIGSALASDRTSVVFVCDQGLVLRVPLLLWPVGELPRSSVVPSNGDIALKAEAKLPALPNGLTTLRPDARILQSRDGETVVVFTAGGFEVRKANHPYDVVTVLPMVPHDWAGHHAVELAFRAALRVRIDDPKSASLVAEFPASQWLIRSTRRGISVSANGRPLALPKAQAYLGVSDDGLRLLTADGESDYRPPEYRVWFVGSREPLAITRPVRLSNGTLRLLGDGTQLLLEEEGAGKPISVRVGPARAAAWTWANRTNFAALIGFFDEPVPAPASWDTLQTELERADDPEARELLTILKRTFQAVPDRGE